MSPSLGWTALLEAIILSDGCDSQTQIVRLLLAHGAAPRAPGKIWEDEPPMAGAPAADAGGCAPNLIEDCA